MKTCSKCHFPKEDDAFNKKGDGLQSLCKLCNSEYLKAHYYKSPDYYLQKAQRRRKMLKEFVLSLKLSCSKCSENHPACLDFHHLGNKESNVGEMVNLGRSKKRILQEIAKCIVLCSNCHRKLHYEERQNCPVV